jgi:hypothetical protein
LLLDNPGSGGSNGHISTPANGFSIGGAPVTSPAPITLSILATGLISLEASRRRLRTAPW